MPATHTANPRKSLFERLTSWFGAGDRRRPAARPHKRARLGFDTLETRDVMSVGGSLPAALLPVAKPDLSPTSARTITTPAAEQIVSDEVAGLAAAQAPSAKTAGAAPRRVGTGPLTQLERTLMNKKWEHLVRTSQQVLGLPLYVADEFILNNNRTFRQTSAYLLRTPDGRFHIYQVISRAGYWGQTGQNSVFFQYNDLSGGGIAKTIRFLNARRTQFQETVRGFDGRPAVYQAVAPNSGVIRQALLNDGY
jgi:hypothetical protein